MQKRISSNSTELVYIGGIGFMFEVNQSLKHNLITPDILTFFDGVPESGEITENNAFSHAIIQTNLRKSLFQYIGYDWVVCSDGVFRKCQKVKCRVELNSTIRTLVFNIDRFLVYIDIVGIISI